MTEPASSLASHVIDKSGAGCHNTGIVHRATAPWSSRLQRDLRSQSGAGGRAGEVKPAAERLQSIGKAAETLRVFGPLGPGTIPPVARRSLRAQAAQLSAPIRSKIFAC